jgi:hypothetical protein
MMMMKEEEQKEEEEKKNCFNDKHGKTSYGEYGNDVVGVEHTKGLSE